MASKLTLGNIGIEVVYKDIKNVHLSVYPPSGRVKIAAPFGTSSDILRVHAISKLVWIKKQQTKLRKQLRETPREYLELESHYVWGKRYLLTLFERNIPPSIELKYNRINFSVRPKTSEEKKKAISDLWYREQIKKEVPKIIAKWEPILGVKVHRFFVQRMRTKWGSCNPLKKSIRLNTDLARKPMQCLEYIVVHEMIHILEPTHNTRFFSLMDTHFPRWQLLRQQLNELPVRHEVWKY